jgi:hypothetical protein
MKRLFLSLIAVVGMSLVTNCYAGDTVSFNRSSFTQTSDAGVYISSSGYLDSVVIGVASTGGVLKIYNSSWTTNSVLVSSISLATVQNIYFNNVQLKGIYYVVDRNSNGVTIIYKQR